MNARDEILRRARAAVADVSASEPAPVPWAYGASRVYPGVVDLFAERVADYRATVHRGSWDIVPDVIASVFPPGASVVVPPGFPPDAVPAGLQVLRDDQADPLTATQLDAADGVLTTSAVGIAVTGTVVLDHGPGQGRRALTLMPDRLACLVFVDRIVDDVPAAIARLDPGQAQTWISGPSATSDIELSRVEGVHGPRDLHVIIVEAP